MQLVKPVEDRKDVPFKYLIRKACKNYKNRRNEIEIIEVRDGKGVHVHDYYCDFGHVMEWENRPCRRQFDDSDWEVEISYACHWDFHKGKNRQYCSPDRKHRAVYGVLDGKFSLWMD